MIDRTPKLFHVPVTELHYRAGLLQHSLSVSQQDKGIFRGSILLALFCAVTEYDDHHRIQWILLAFSQQSVSVEDSYCMWECMLSLFFSVV